MNRRELQKLLQEIAITFFHAKENADSENIIYEDYIIKHARELLGQINKLENITEPIYQYMIEPIKKMEYLLFSISTQDSLEEGEIELGIKNCKNALLMCNVIGMDISEEEIKAYFQAEPEDIEKAIYNIRRAYYEKNKQVPERQELYIRPSIKDSKKELLRGYKHDTDLAFELANEAIENKVDAIMLAETFEIEYNLWMHQQDAIEESFEHNYSKAIIHRQEERLEQHELESPQNYDSNIREYLRRIEIILEEENRKEKREEKAEENNGIVLSEEDLSIYIEALMEQNEKKAGEDIFSFRQMKLLEECAKRLTENQLGKFVITEEKLSDINTIIENEVKLNTMEIEENGTAEKLYIRNTSEYLNSIVERLRNGEKINIEPITMNTAVKISRKNMEEEQINKPPQSKVVIGKQFGKYQKKDSSKDYIAVAEQTLRDVFTGQINTFLDTIAQLTQRKFSVNNLLLIYKQNPSTTFLSTYNEYPNKYGVQVAANQQGIKLIQPNYYDKSIGACRKEIDRYIKNNGSSRIGRYVFSSGENGYIIQQGFGEKLVQIKEKVSTQELVDFLQNKVIGREYAYPPFEMVSYYDISQTKERTYTNEKGEKVIDSNTANLKRNITGRIYEGKLEEYIFFYRSLAEMAKKHNIHLNVSEKDVVSSVNETFQDNVFVKMITQIISQMQLNETAEIEAVTYTLCKRYGLEYAYTGEALQELGKGKEIKELKNIITHIRNVVFAFDRELEQEFEKQQEIGIGIGVEDIQKQREEKMNEEENIFVYDSKNDDAFPQNPANEIFNLLPVTRSEWEETLEVTWEEDMDIQEVISMWNTINENSINAIIKSDHTYMFGELTFDVPVGEFKERMMQEGIESRMKGESISPVNTDTYKEIIENYPNIAPSLMDDICKDFFDNEEQERKEAEIEEAKENPEVKLEEKPDMCSNVQIQIYQVADDKIRDYAFYSFEELVDILKREIDKRNYDLVMETCLKKVNNFKTLPETIYEIGNTSDILSQYVLPNKNLRSISMSDILALKKEEWKTPKFYYVDRVGFKELDSFLEKGDMNEKDIKEFLKVYHVDPVVAITGQEGISKEKAQIISGLSQKILPLPETNEGLSVYLNKGERLAKEIMDKSIYATVIINESSYNGIQKGEIMSLQEANIKFEALESAVALVQREHGTDSFDGFKNQIAFTVFFKNKSRENAEIYAYNSRMHVGDGNQKDLIDYIGKDFTKWIEKTEEILESGNKNGRNITSEEILRYKKVRESINKCIPIFNKAVKEKGDIQKQDKEFGAR